MNNLVLFNHQILPASEIKFSALTPATFYGKGIFTTTAIFNAKPFLWEKHWLRLLRNAEKLGIDLSDFSSESINNSLSQLIKRNSLSNGRARLTFFDEKPSQLWSFNSENRTSLLITTAFFPNSSEIKLTVSPHPINSKSPLVNIKSCNYLEHIMALEETKKRGFDEAIRLNEKSEIVSGCLANIFWIKEGKIFTPSLETGCLAGTTREFILENFPIREVKANLADLDRAEVIFF